MLVLAAGHDQSYRGQSSHGAGSSDGGHGFHVLAARQVRVGGVRGADADVSMLLVVNNNTLTLSSELHQRRRPGRCLFNAQQQQNRTRRHGWAECP